LSALRRSGDGQRFTYPVWPRSSIRSVPRTRIPTSFAVGPTTDVRRRNVTAGCVHASPRAHPFPSSTRRA
jgi:hypothetical protein